MCFYSQHKNSDSKKSAFTDIYMFLTAYSRVQACFSAQTAMKQNGTGTTTSLLSNEYYN